MVVDYGIYADRVLRRPCIGTPISPSRWTRPPPGRFKINTDTAIFASGGVGMGVIIRNSEGSIVAIASKRVSANWSPEVAEAMAGRFGLLVAKGQGLRNILLESDAQNFIYAVSKRTVIRNSLGLILEDVLGLASMFSSTLFSHVKRSGNTVAHHIARILPPSSAELVIVSNFPRAIIALAELDLI